MGIKPSSKRTDFITVLLSFIAPAGVTLLLWATRANEANYVQAFVAFFLLYIPLQTYNNWNRGSRADLPLFSMVAFMFWLYYALALFWGQNSIDAPDYAKDLTEESITRTMFMTLCGVLALWLGMKSKLGYFFVPSNPPDIHPKQTHWAYLRLILVLGTLGSVYANSPYILGEGGRQIIITFLTVVPVVAFGIIFRSYLRGESTKLDKILIAGFLPIRLITALASGWIGPVVMLLFVCAAIYIGERRKLPRWVFIFVVAYVLFLQPGKAAVREKYWYGGEQAGQLEKVEFWVTNSFDKWGTALSDPSGEAVRDLGYQSLSRTSLLTQSANVLQLTPSVVPYQYGQLYSYMAVTLIPRFVWPEKPSVNDANQFYQVAYGLTPEDRLSNVSIAVGFMTEGYINFGWPGVFLIMFLVGVFFSFFQQTFLSGNSNLLFKAIGLALLPQFLNIEGQLAQYLAGIVQQVLFILLIFLPIMTRKHLSQDAASALGTYTYSPRPSG